MFLVMWYDHNDRKQQVKGEKNKTREMHLEFMGWNYEKFVPKPFLALFSIYHIFYC